MYRPPPQSGHPSGGGSAGRGRVPHQPNYYPQNPNFPYFPNPYFQNPNFPNVYFQNPNTQNPNFQVSTSQTPTSRNSQNPNSKNPDGKRKVTSTSQTSPKATPPKPKLTMEKIEAAVVKAHSELLSAGESVSAWKVSQAALASLQVDSWSTLGLQLQDVPSLKKLLVMEGKVNAFIHCFVAARKIISLYDLEVALCKNEGLERFEELGLGPLCAHSLAKHYFSVPSDMTEIFKISSEEIIFCLYTFMGKSEKWPIDAEDFLGFLAEQNSVASKENLGVRIQSLGLHLSLLKEAKNAEKALIFKTIEKLEHSNRSKGKENIRSSKPYSSTHMNVKKKDLDKRFDEISDRIKSFSSICNFSGGKHIRFCSDDEDSDTDDDDDTSGDTADGGIVQPHCNSSQSKNGQQSSCPYPSTSEEMVRLGLKNETGEKLLSSSNQMTDDSGLKSSGKKRKRKQKEKYKNASSTCKFRVRRSKKFKASFTGDLLKKFTKVDCSPSSFCKSQKKEKVIDKEDQKKLKRLVLNSSDMDKFMTMWREACQEYSVAEVFLMMMNFYMPGGMKEKSRKLFAAYPCIGLLNVAITAIKNGTQGSVYDIVHAFGEHECNDEESAPTEVIEIGKFKEDLGIDRKRSDNEHTHSVSVNDIIGKITKYFGVNPIISREEDFVSGKQFAIFNMVRDCETWLVTQFSVKDFESLGHGSFCTFLERHASQLPQDLHSILSGRISDSACLIAMLQEQLGVLLSQVENNMKDKCEISESDISLVLRRQFPTISFDIVGNDPGKCLVKLIQQTKPHCIQYSAPLLGKQLNGDSFISNGTDSREATNTEIGQGITSYEHISSRDAIDCLLKAPMLSDLRYWSHWDLVYAPSLGPLPNWLLKEVETKELLCLATIDGRIIRIDHSATVDGFLEAVIQISPFKVALNLLSILSLYKGINNAPLSLLKCYAQRGIGVIMKNATDTMELSNEMHKREACTLSEPLHGMESGTVTVARFILGCLCYLPSEFRNFGSEILVSGLRSVAKNAPLVILNECSKTDQSLMLHDIGLSVGIQEWIDDHYKFRSSATWNDKFESCRSVGSLNSMPNISEEPSSACEVTNASQENMEDDSSSAFEIRRLDILLANGHQGSGLSCEVKDFDGCSGAKSSVSEDILLHEANSIVESIRREEFGLDNDLSSSENHVLKKSHARLGRALHCLSQELYSQDSHLLLELVQNADDNIYPTNADPTLAFVLQDSGITVLNNEQGFSSENIMALCDIGNSTKKGSTGYIGHKGIGFKSVFRITDAPEIHSNGFHLKFDITEGQIGFILPTLISPCNIDSYRPLLSDNNDKRFGTKWNTCIVLPFRSNCKNGAGMTNIISMFSDLHPSLLLFLHRLQCIKFVNMLNDTRVIMRREILSNGIIKVSHGPDTMSWLVTSKKLQANLLRPDVQITKISIAFTLEECENGEYKSQLRQQPVFAFLPLRKYGLKFIIQGDFVLPSSREEVDGNSAWNQWLLSKFPSLFVEARESFSVLPGFQKNPGKAVTAFMSFVPLGGEVHGFFSHLPHMIISELRASKCLLLDCPDLTWDLPCKVLRGWNEQVRKLLPDSLLREQIGLGYLSRDVVLSDALAKALGITDYGPRILFDFISSVCHTSGGVKSLGLEWLSSWLSTFQLALSTHSSAYLSSNAGVERELFNALSKVPFIPLSDGSYSSLSDGPIWLPFDSFGIGMDCKSSAKDFPSLYAKLRTVSPLLFSTEATITSTTSEAIGDCIAQLLCKVGVQKLSGHEVIKNHILTALTGVVYSDEDRSLMIEYLTFIMIHFQDDCAQCLSEKEGIISELQKRRAVLTNCGFRCAFEEPIHFSKEYKNPVDTNKLIGTLDAKWLEVDVAYLEHPVTQSLSSGLLKWRNFFQELGVTDFIQVTGTSRSVPHEGASMGEVSVVKDWESPELVNFLSTYSLKRYRENCIYLLDVLDKMWDDHYSAYSRCCTISKSEVQKTTESLFMRSIREFRWIASTMDQELHQSKDLFHNCEEVRCLLGNLAPYSVPQVTSKILIKDIGFKTEVLLDDALEILQSWSLSKAPFISSIAQMSKLYSFLSDGFTTSKLKIPEEFISSSFIFVPFLCSSKYKDNVSGIFLSPKELYWHDPTGCADKIMETIRLNASTMKNQSLPCRTLSAYYPSLHDFFVNICTVQKIPPFDNYIQILGQMSSVALPSQAAHEVFQVLVKWADDIKYGLITPKEILDLKENLSKLENTVLPTLHDKWVSLHPSFGLICWSDDDALKNQFKHSNGLNFLSFGKLSEEEQDMLSGKLAPLMLHIGIPAISEIVSREAITYGTEDNKEKASLVNWILPYAQRYLYKLYPDIYTNFKQLGLQKLSQLQVLVVDKLFYKHSLKGRESTSKKRIECSCLLQGSTLYITSTADSHTIFLELSRLFFNGSTDLQFANFLHMITTMTESGSSCDQIEFFIVNSQKVPKLTVEDPIWCLTLPSEQDTETPQPTTTPTIPEQIIPSRKPSSAVQNWPPTDWKTAPDRKFALANYNLTYPASVSEQYNPVVTDAGTSIDEPILLDVDDAWIIEETSPANPTTVLQDPPPVVVPEKELDEYVERDPPNRIVEDNRLRTGKKGESIAYRYFVEKLGPDNVKWVNEATETGLPYDLIIGNDEHTREYIEVKSTIVSRKKWFTITSREWQFASEKGEAYSIAHVVMYETKKASVTVLKNPWRLCQQNVIKLALLMADEHARKT